MSEAPATCAAWRAENLTALDDSALVCRYAAAIRHTVEQKGIFFLQGASGGSLSVLLNVIERQTLLLAAPARAKAAPTAKPKTTVKAKVAPAVKKPATARKTPAAKAKPVARSKTVAKPTTRSTTTATKKATRK